MHRSDDADSRNVFHRALRQADGDAPLLSTLTSTRPRGQHGSTASLDDFELADDPAGRSRSTTSRRCRTAESEGNLVRNDRLPSSSSVPLQRFDTLCADDEFGWGPSALPSSDDERDRLPVRTHAQSRRTTHRAASYRPPAPVSASVSAGLDAGHYSVSHRDSEEEEEEEEEEKRPSPPYPPTSSSSSLRTRSTVSRHRTPSASSRRTPEDEADEPDEPMAESHDVVPAADSRDFLPASELVQVGREYVGLDALDLSVEKEELLVRKRCGSSVQYGAALIQARPGMRTLRRSKRSSARGRKRKHDGAGALPHAKRTDDGDQVSVADEEEDEGEREEEEEEGVPLDPSAWDDHSDPAPPFCFLCDFVQVTQHGAASALQGLIRNGVHIGRERLVNHMYAWYMVNAQPYLPGRPEWTKRAIEHHLLYEGNYPELWAAWDVHDQNRMLQYMKRNQLVRVHPDTQQELLDIKQARTWSDLCARRTQAMQQLGRMMLAGSSSS